MRYAFRRGATSVVAATLAASLAACGGGSSIGPQPSSPAPGISSSPIGSTTPGAPGGPATPGAPGGPSTPGIPGGPATPGAPGGTPTPGVTTAPVTMPTIGKGGPPGTAMPATPQPIPASATPSSTATLSPPGTPLPAGEKIYVVNHGVHTGNAAASNAQTSSLTVYPLAATGAASPLATLAGPNTGLDQAQFVTVDENGTVYVTNQGTSLGGTLTVYAAGALNGNLPPSAVVTGLYQPEGVCVDDVHKYVFVVTYYTIDIYREYAGGALVLDHTIAGNPPGSSDPNANRPQLFGDYSCFVNHGFVYIAGSQQWIGFKTTDAGNVSPTYDYAGAAALLFSDLGVMADPSGNVFLTNLNSNAISEFMSPAITPTPGPTASAQSTTNMPGVTTTGTAFNEPLGMALDAAGNAFVTNIGTNSVLRFSSTAVLSTGVPTATIAGPGTGLDRPYGVYAR